MTKGELIEFLAERADITINKSGQIVATIFDSMSDALISGGRVEIRGFGSLSIREYSERTARNPKTGEGVDVKAKKRPYFKVGKELGERIMGQLPK